MRSSGRHDAQQACSSRFIRPTSDDATPGSIDDERHESYLFVHGKSVPGILGKVASRLGRHGVSVEQVEQDPRGPGLPADMWSSPTHRGREGARRDRGDRRVRRG